ncbi:hypothetical protein SRHO_G00026690 [Serrasalmus rhombeus]
MSVRCKVFKSEHFQKQSRSDLRSQWLINIRRDQFTISPHTKVCSRHFIPDHLIEPKTPEGRRRLTKDAVPLLFEWNGYSIQAPRLSVWERRERPADPTSLEDPSTDLTVDHDYCSAPEPSSLDMSCAENEDLSREVEELRNQLHELRVQLTFGLQRFSGSDEDIRFYTRGMTTRQVLQPVDEFFLFLVHLCWTQGERLGTPF